MHKLDARSARILLSALERLHADSDPETLADRAVQAAMGMVQADWLTFDFFSRNTRYEDTAWSSDPILLDPEYMRPFAELLHQHPIVGMALANPNGEALKITDAVSQNAFERTELYNRFYRPASVNKQMGLALLSEGDLTMTYAFARKGVEFTDREKAIASAAAPHFVNAIRNGFAFRRISDALQATGSGVIALGANGKLNFASAFARTLLEKYFPAEPLAADSLPTMLSTWLSSARMVFASSFEYSLPVEPFRVAASDGSALTVRLLDGRAAREDILLLEERRSLRPDDFRPFGLTPRECEVLYWITEGKTDPDIARICDISPRTVEKHVENIYKKLGVETRTAALSKALSIIH